VNSDHATVLAGEPDAVATVLEPLRERGVFCRAVRTNCATHVPNVERFREPLFAELAELAPQPGDVPMYSTALDRVVAGRELDAGYWMANMRRPVRFASAVRSILSDRTPTLFIEISPHPLLAPAIEDAIETSRADASVAETLVRETSESEAVLTTVTAAYVRGNAPDWSRLYEDGWFVPLPTYPWQRTRYWVERTAAPIAAGAGRPWTGPAPAREQEPAADPVRPARLAITSAQEIAEQLVRRAAEVLSAPPESIDRGAPLHEAGLDSLLGAKLSLRLTQELDLQVTTGDLLDDRPLTEIADLLHRQLTTSHAAPTVPSG
jgi:acyl transferase domain-containing protein